MEWAMILVIILSITLAIFLVVSIILMIKLIKISKQINSITSTAQRTVSSVENKVQSFMAIATPMAAAKYIQSFVKNFNKKK